MKQTLGQIASITMGQSPSSEFYNSDHNGLPFLQGCTTFGRLYPSYNTWASTYNKEAFPGDILFTVRAPVGDVNLCQDHIAIGRGLASIRATDVLPKYLFYLLEANKSQFQFASSGTIYQSINRDKLLGVVLDVHSPDEQRHIVGTIGSVDDLIEKEKELIRRLDDYGQRLFASFFEVLDSAHYKLCDLCDFVPGYSYSGEELKESNIGMVTIKSVERTGGFKTDGIKSLQPEKPVKDAKKCNIGDILVAHTDLTKNKEVIGRPIIITSKNGFGSLTFSTDMVKVISKTNEFSNPLIYKLLYSPLFKAHALGYCNGSTVVHLNRKALETYEFDGPSIDVVKKLNQKLKVLQSEIITRFAKVEKIQELKYQLLDKYF